MLKELSISEHTRAHTFADTSADLSKALPLWEVD